MSDKILTNFDCIFLFFLFSFNPKVEDSKPSRTPFVISEFVKGKIVI